MKIRIGFFFLLGLCLSVSGCAEGGGFDEPPGIPEDATADAEGTREPTQAVPGETPPDLAGETITIYLLGDDKGVYGDLTENIFPGALDYISNLNAKGGIFGAEVRLRYTHTGGSEEEARAAFEQLVEEGEPVIFVLYGTAEDALAEVVRTERVPAIGLGMGQIPSTEIAGGYLFRLAPTAEEQFLFLLEYLVVHWETVRPAGAERPVAGYVTWEEGESAGGLSEAVRAKAEELFVPIEVEARLRKSPNASATAAILELETRRVNLVLTDAYGPGPGVLMNDLNNLGLRSFFTLAGTNWSLDPSLSDSLSDPALWEGLIAPLPYAWWGDGDNAGIQQLSATAAAHDRKGDRLDSGYLLAQGALALGVEAIEQAILAEGFQHLDGQGVYLELANMEDFSVMEGLFTVDYTDGNRAPVLLSVRQTGGTLGEVEVLEEFAPLKDE